MSAIKLENIFQKVTKKNKSTTVNQTFSELRAWSVCLYLSKRHIFPFLFGVLISPAASVCDCVLWLLLFLGVRCQMASSHAISSRLVFEHRSLFLKSNHNKKKNTAKLHWHTHTDIHSGDLTLWLLFHSWFFGQKSAGALQILLLLTLTLCFISNSTRNSAAMGSRLCLYPFVCDYVSSDAFGQSTIVHSCLRSDDVGLLFSFVRPADNSLFPSCPRCILASIWTSKCRAFMQREIIFKGTLFFSPGLPPVEPTERPLSFCVSWGT